MARRRASKAQRIQALRRYSLRPLRAAVNAALKRAGIPKVVHSRGRGIASSVITAGWRTESEIHAIPPHISVRIYGRESSPVANAELKALRAKVPKALSRFRFDREGRVFRVFKPLEPPAGEPSPRRRSRPAGRQT